MPYEERLRCIKEAGFDEVILSWEDEIEPRLIPKEDMVGMARDAGLEVTNFHAPYRGYNDIWEKDAAGSRYFLDELCGFVEDCAHFDVPAIVVHTCDRELNDFNFENGLRFFETLGKFGQDKGVDIAVENVSRQDLLYKLLDEIQLPHFGICYDSSHDHMKPEWHGKILDRYGKRIKALHISDNDFKEDRHWIPGEGKIDFETLIPRLIGFGQDTIAFEVQANQEWRKKTPQAFCSAVRRSLDFLKLD